MFGRLKLDRILLSAVTDEGMVEELYESGCCS